MNKITVFTPTYNRAYIIDNLYQSLLSQTDMNFEWLVIDDGSSDGTKEYFEKILLKGNPFKITYKYTDNGGKQRAINTAVKYIATEYTFIVDSDDKLTPDAIEYINRWISSSGLEHLAGVSGVKGDMAGNPLGGSPKIDGDYIECTNLERAKYNLKVDMAEIYKTSMLKHFSFDVWPGEKFVPEALVWDKIALAGYSLRWYKKVIYLCDYREDGLTKNSWKLLKNNPMGYAFLFDHNCSIAKTIRKKNKWAIQMMSSLFLANNWKYVMKMNNRIRGIILTPIGFLLSIRRKSQFKKYI